MRTEGLQSLTIEPALCVTQRDITFYIASIKASDLFEICAGLRQDDFRDRLIEDGTSGDTADQAAKRFVDSISTSSIAAEVKRIESDPYREDEPFQRLVDETRVRKIAAYLTEDFSLIPNSIILALRDSATCEISVTKTAKLVLEWSDGVPTNVIDGQHRVEALKLFFTNDLKAAQDFFIPICLLVDLPFYVQAHGCPVISSTKSIG